MFLYNTRQQKITSIQIRWKLDYFGSAPHHLSDEDIHKMTGFVHRRQRPVEDKPRRTARFHALCALTLCQTNQRGVTEKAKITLFDRDVDLPIDSFIKKRRQSKIIRRPEVALCQTWEDKKAKRNQDMIF